MSLKSKHRGLFLAMRADCKDYPGGLVAIAPALGRNYHTLANQMNPDSEQVPPSLEVMVEIMKMTGGKRTAFALAQLVDQVTMDVQFDHHPPHEAVKMFMGLVHEASEAMGKGSEFAADMRFDATERMQLEPLLMALLRSTVELLHTLRG